MSATGATGPAEQPSGFRSYSYYRKDSFTPADLKKYDWEGAYILMKAISVDKGGAEKLAAGRLTVTFEIVEQNITQEQTVLIHGVPTSIPPGVVRFIKAKY